MKLLKEIYHKDNLNKNGRVFTRKAVRGIILNDNKVLMIFSSINGDYKFPGGGVEPGETNEETLIREVREESGALVSRIERCFGKVKEYNEPLEKEYDIFIMTSYYYLCQIEKSFGGVNLDEYEENLGFEPVWIDIEDAIQTNKSIINSSFRETPRWTRRETHVLDLIREKL